MILELFEPTFRKVHDEKIQEGRIEHKKKEG